jgi:hypothetical protein
MICEETNCYAKLLMSVEGDRTLGREGWTNVFIAELEWWI